MNLKFETIVQMFRKIIQPNAVKIMKSTNEQSQKKSSKKSSHKMALYPGITLTYHRRNTTHQPHFGQAVYTPQLL